MPISLGSRPGGFSLSQRASVDIRMCAFHSGTWSWFKSWVWFSALLFGNLGPDFVSAPYFWFLASGSGYWHLALASGPPSLFMALALWYLSHDWFICSFDLLSGLVSHFRLCFLVSGALFMTYHEDGSASVMRDDHPSWTMIHYPAKLQTIMLGCLMS